MLVSYLNPLKAFFFLFFTCFKHGELIRLVKTFAAQFGLLHICSDSYTILLTVAHWFMVAKAFA